MSNLLERIFPEEEIILNKTTGDKRIFQAKNVFSSWIDPDFKQLVSASGQKTREVPVEIYQLTEHAGLEELTRELKTKTKSLSLVQSQIILFCQEKEKYLHPNWITFFFLDEPQGDFLIGVSVACNGLRINIHSFKDLKVLRGKCFYRFVVPKESSIQSDSAFSGMSIVSC
jgi:hypothetical protein